MSRIARIHKFASHLSLALIALLCASSLMARTAESDAMYAAALKQDDVKAIRTLIAARKLAPADERIVYRIGFLFHKMNRRPEARQAYEDTLALNECNTRALNNLGNILKDQGEAENARRRYKQAIACDPEFTVSHYNLGNLLRREGAHSDAIRHYEIALKQTPRHYRSHHNLGLIYLQEAQLAAKKRPVDPALVDSAARKAGRHFDQACEINPRDALNFYNRGRLYEFRADRVRAVSDYKRALSLLRRNSAFKGRLRKRIQRLQAQPQ